MMSFQQKDKNLALIRCEYKVNILIIQNIFYCDLAMDVPKTKYNNTNNHVNNVFKI